MFDSTWYFLTNFAMDIDYLIKKIAILEKRIEHLESKLSSQDSTSSRDEKWSEFRSIIRLQEKNTSKALT